MANLSAEFLYIDDDDFEQPSRHFRTRSSGYVDYLAEAEEKERRSHERQMKRYNDGKYPATSSSHHRSTSDRLCVPIFEPPLRRPRSDETTGRPRDSPPRGYNVQERQPGPRPTYDLDSEPPLPTQLPVRLGNRTQHQKKPSIKVQIHQDNPPSSTTTTGATTRKTSSPSPRSPTAQPLLQYQYNKLQDKLSQTSSVCAPFLDVEAANPKDLTFAKITEQVNGFAFELRVWAYTACLKNLVKIDVEKKDIVEMASRILDRLIDRIDDLKDACMQARPRDLKFQPLPEIHDEEIFSRNNPDLGSSDPTGSLGFIIHSSLHGIEMQIQNLKLLARSLQEAAPEARDEVVEVSRLVEEVARYFGSQDALDRYQIDEVFAGRKALEEARHAAAH